MARWSEEQKRKIIRRLFEVGARAPCPRCGKQSFTVPDGYFNQAIQMQMGGIVLGGPTMPSIVVVCTQCGFMSQHALGALGMLPKEGEDE